MPGLWPIVKTTTVVVVIANLSGKTDMRQPITGLELDREQMIKLWIKHKGVCRGVTCMPEVCYYKVETNNAPCPANKVYEWALKNKDNRFGNCNSIWED
jgi:hypothetical protein